MYQGKGIIKEQIGLNLIIAGFIDFKRINLTLANYNCKTVRKRKKYKEVKYL